MGVLDAVFPADRAAPMVTLLDGHPHALSFMAEINRVRAIHLGVVQFGQSGELDAVYAHHGLDAISVANAVRDLL
ncbi:hypothetical protein [Cumulibacter manganitolerans]|uniref:hypothetical protein n=1 Tax=Cumulibacter manganitolerans TaxID=1884992 RepID=UPI001E414DFB|nr:hypothetical protein [Cumulibacter manganitolerans]